MQYQTRDTQLAELDEIASKLSGYITNNALSFHNPETEEKLADAFEQIRAALHAEEHYEGADDIGYEAERFDMRDMFTVPSYTGIV